MSHHNYPNHGIPFRPSPTGGNSHGGSSYSRQEAPPPDPLSHSIPHELYNHVPQNAWVPLVPGHDQPEGHRENILPPIGGAAGPGTSRVQDPHYIDMAYQGIIDYRPQPLSNPAYVFPNVGHAQGIPVQVQPNAPVNLEHNPLGYVPPHVAPGLVQAAFPHPFVHRVPTPDPPPQAGAENLRRLVSHYLHHPDAQVSMVTIEAGTAGRIKVAVIFETTDF